MKAIETKYRGPTNHRGARVTATDSDGNSVSVPFDYDAGANGSHRLAAKALLDKMGWGGNWFGGGTKAGMVWVCVTGNTDRIRKTG